MRIRGAPLFRTFRAKVTIVLIFSMLLTAGVSNFLISRYALEARFNSLRTRLKVIAQTSALMIDADTLMRVPLNRDGINSPAYKEIAEKLNKIKEANPPLRYVYTLAKTDKEGIWQFVVDPEPETAKGVTAYPGDKYDVSRFPEMLRGLESPSADTRLEIDEWGITLSGYAPIRDKTGRAVAVVGVDMIADDVYKIQKNVMKISALVLVLTVILSVFLGTLISNRVTEPVERLVEGTRHLSSGNLRHRVEIRGDDEISELATSFNEMAGRLYESRKKLYSYFYRVAQSFVLILEARDPYTRGHSQRIADYAERVAERMGFSKEKRELLKEAALLHDIGKLGIQESILHKKEKLTDEEWEIIRKHPIIGEDILKPVTISEEMLAVIRGHHERYDGGGYPDRLSGENISIFAAIVSVADAYDAMTSPRAYRPALSEREAIEELKRNSGTQLNPMAVEAFIKILPLARKPRL